MSNVNVFGNSYPAYNPSTRHRPGELKDKMAPFIILIYLIEQFMS